MNKLLQLQLGLVIQMSDFDISSLAGEQRFSAMCSLSCQQLCKRRNLHKRGKDTRFSSDSTLEHPTALKGHSFVFFVQQKD